ncbi:MAG: nucleotidyltransferase domain-containing protein [Candidatus Riflebacteria bacterium]|nr:nucleotidyltransferase domain-containing protein [Candidatus Riflebacteria bacterium]
MLNSSTTYGLPEDALLKICRVFQQFQQVSKVIIYGSRSTGNYRSTSDIDITIKGTIDFTDFLKLASQLDDLMLPWKIDLSILEQIDNPALVEDITRTGKILFQRSDADPKPNS